MKTDPEHLGGYWIAGRLGSGGQGVVYEAYDDDGERFAIKVLHGSPGGREVEAAKRVRSFCTARLLAADLDGPVPYLVSEFVAGPSLRVKVAESGPYTGDDLYRLATGMATALTAIHEAGVIHRELKPDNVLIGPDGPRVIDFGLAGTAENVVAGTPTYLPPEVFKGLPAGESGDVYAWGCVTLFAATGEDPFAAGDLGAVMHRVLTTEAALDGLEQPLRDLVGQALDKDQEKRPSARELLLKLLITADDPLAEGRDTAMDLRSDAQEPSLGMMAERLYGDLSRAEQAVVPEVFLRLAGLDGNGVDTRRRVPRDELLDDLDPERAAVAERVIKVYGEAGLLQSEPGADQTITMAHAALLRAWPRLHEWLDAEREGLPAQRSLATAARAWQRAGRREVDLLRGGPLDSALSWAATGRRHVTLGRTERSFIDASTSLARRRVRRRRVVTGLLAVLLVVALAATGVAVWQGAMAREALADTTARSLAGQARALLATDPAMARRLSAAAWRLAPVSEARSALMSTVADPVRAVFAEPDAAADSVYALDPAGRWLVAVRGGQARVWDPATRQLLMEIKGVGRSATSAAVNAGGTVLAVGTAQDVRLFDTRTGALLRSLPVRRALHLAFHGDVLATTDRDGLGVLWRPDGTRLMARPESKLTTDGRRVLVTSVEGLGSTRTHRRPAEVWEDGRKLRLGWLARMEGTYTAAELGPDGRTVALSGAKGTQVFELGSGRRLGGPWSSAGHLAYSPDGRYLAEGGSDLVVVRQTGTWKELLSVSDQIGGPIRPVVEKGGLRYVGAAGRMKSYALPRTPVTPIGPESATRAFSRDGSVLAVADGEKIGLWDPVRRRPLGALRTGSKLMAFSWDGKRLAAADAGATAVDIWDVAQGARVGTLTTSAGVAGLTFSPDGRTVAVSTAGWVELHSGGQARRVAGVAGPGLAYRPDGLMLAVFGEERVYTVDPVAAAPTVPNASGRASGAVAFSPDGKLAATGNTLGQVTLWDTSLRDPLGPPIATGAMINTIAFSRDSTAVAVTGFDPGDLTVWDVRTGAQLGQGVDLGVAEESVTSSNRYGEPAYALAHGADLLGVGPTGVVGTAVIDPERAIGRICAQDGELSPAAWAQYVPGLSPRKIC